MTTDKNNQAPYFFSPTEPIPHEAVACIGAQTRLTPDDFYTAWQSDDCLVRPQKISSRDEKAFSQM